MDELRVEQKKKILKDICDEEIKNNNLDIKVEIVEVIEYEIETLKQLLSSKDIKGTLVRYFLPSHAAGVYLDNPKKKTKEILIFLRDKITSEKLTNKLIDNIWTCYHELRHAMQYEEKTKMDEFSYDVFSMRISPLYHNKYDYRLEHDKYYDEIDADLYAYQKTKEYLIKNYPELYEREKEYLDSKYEKARFYQMTYDLSFEIERTLQQLKKSFSDSGKKTVNMKSLEEKISPVFSIFLDNKLKYKPIKRIIRHPKFKKLDKRIIYAFFSSKTFLEKIDYNRLSYEEAQILKESLEYSIDNHQKQLEMLLHAKEITLDFYLKETKSILAKISLESNYYNRQFRSSINPFRNGFEQIEYERSLPDRLQSIDEQMEKQQQKRRGYITLNICYIISLLLSISTIIYLLVK